ANQVKGGAPPMALSARAFSLSPPETSILAPSGGNEIARGASPGPEAAISGRPSGRKRCSAGGRSEVRAKTTPVGAGGKGVRFAPIRVKASNRIGAAGVRPTRSETGSLSGRPTQTATVLAPSKPTAQAS